MKAEILTIGDELLIGQVVNTNAAWIGEQLTLLGVDVRRVVTIGDDEAAIRTGLQEAHEVADLVVITGGLGPTHDDVTKTAVAAFFGVGLRFDEEVFKMVSARFARHGTPMAASNRSQAQVPEGFEVLPNTEGTAPGLWRQEPDGGRIVVVVPGVPYEMKHLFQQAVLPRVARASGLRNLRQRTLLTTGIGESTLQEELGDLTGLLGHDVRLAFLPSIHGVRLRMTAFGADAAGRLDDLEHYLRSRAGTYVYGVDNDTLETVVGRFLHLRRQTIAVAESCTGGLIAHRLTNVAGSSAYVVGGVVAYSNDVKVRLLGVDPGTLASEGAVSEAVALQMARGVRARFGADLGLATTGIMGPTGGTDTKPVGTVWVGYATAGGERAVLLQLATDRQRNKERAATAALNLVRLDLQRLNRKA